MVSAWAFSTGDSLCNLTFCSREKKRKQRRRRRRSQDWSLVYCSSTVVFRIMGLYNTTIHLTGFTSNVRYIYLSLFPCFLPFVRWSCFFTTVFSHYFFPPFLQVSVRHSFQFQLKLKHKNPPTFTLTLDFYCWSLKTGQLWNILRILDWNWQRMLETSGGASGLLLPHSAVLSVFLRITVWSSDLENAF